MMRNSGSQTQVTRIVFVHRSTGAEIIRDGGVRSLLKRQAPDVEFWDYGFEPPSLKRRVRGLIQRSALMPTYYYGLGDGDGRRHPVTLHLADTDPDNLAALFSQPASTSSASALARLLEFDVIAFKSCFTIFPVRDEKQLNHFQDCNRVIRDTIVSHPDKLFIPLTPPPLRRESTTAEEAARARRYAHWLMGEAFYDAANVVPFDLFDVLSVAESEPGANTLRPEFCRADVGDSHPNALANRTVASAWATWLAATMANHPGVVRAAQTAL